MARVELHFETLTEGKDVSGELGFDPFCGSWRYVATSWMVDPSMGAATVATALDLLPDGDWYVLVYFREERPSFRVPQLGNVPPKNQKLRLQLRASKKPLQGRVRQPEWADGIEYETFQADSFWKRL